MAKKSEGKKTDTKKSAKRSTQNASPQKPTPIKLCILWHQHQPYYRAGDKFVLPWAWLHATKDYLEMAQHFARHPKMHGTINLVPSLLKQLDEYVREEATDNVVRLMSKPAEELTSQEQDFMIEHFFLANPHTVIFRSPRYHELYDRVFQNPEDRSEKRSRFSTQDYRDLAVHYSLAWTGEIARNEEPFKSLVEKDREYTEDDKRILASAQIENVKRIVTLHKELAMKGQVELTTTPFYHPILPLLIDTDSAKESMLDVGLPLERFQGPEEASLQLSRAREYFTSHMSMEPKGMWPSEGSISDAALRMIRQQGFTWTATDEAVLAKTVGGSMTQVGDVTIKPEHAKYFPWRFETEHGPIALFFRDHRLSDNIGFTYQSWGQQDAVNDLLSRVENIRGELIESYGEAILEHAVVSIILDGENCWEYYPNNGFEFLDKLYGTLESTDLIAPLTFSEALSKSGLASLPQLSHVVAGSWINANFRIWIGHPEDNAAWDAVSAARAAVERSRQRLAGMTGEAHARLSKQIERAHEELLIAEGSDWCWWYGDDHYSVQKHMFDELFRMHVRSIYVHLDIQVPEILRHPIPERPDIYQLYHRPSDSQIRTSNEPPRLAGKLLNETWAGVPNTAPAKLFGAMHRSMEYEIEDLQVAQVGEEVLFRIILSPALPEHATLRAIFNDPKDIDVRIASSSGVVSIAATEQSKIRSCVDETVEFALPVTMLEGTKLLRFAIEIVSDGPEVTRIPEDGSIECAVTSFG